MSFKPVDVFFPNAKEEREKGICPTCHKPVGKRKDKISEVEFGISGMCQECQDSVFGED